MPIDLPVPWRTFTLLAPLSPQEVEAVLARALRIEVVRGYSAADDRVRFLMRLGDSSRSGWLYVTCRIERAEPESEGTGSRLTVRTRGPLATIGMLGAAGLLLPIALVVAAVRAPREINFVHVLFFGLVAPIVWFVFAREYDRGARALEKRLRGALQR